jgi:hypothetical protein
MFVCPYVRILSIWCCNVIYLFFIKFFDSDRADMSCANLKSQVATKCTENCIRKKIIFVITRMIRMMLFWRCRRFIGVCVDSDMARTSYRYSTVDGTPICRLPASHATRSLSNLILSPGKQRLLPETGKGAHCRLG